jgi:hypothetical protein
MQTHLEIISSSLDKAEILTQENLDRVLSYTFFIELADMLPNLQ